MIWFLSREGEYLYMLQSRRNLNCGPAQVLWVSRALCFEQLIYEVTQGRLDPTLLYPLPAEEFFSVYSRMLGVTRRVPPRGLSVEAFLATEGLSIIDLLKDIVTSSTSKYEKYRDYLRASAGEASRITVYDVGWHGTMQYCLQILIHSYLSNQVEVRGIYLGTFSSQYPINTHGLVCQDSRSRESYLSLKHCVEIVEIMLTSQLGRVLGVASENGKWVAVRDDFHELGGGLRRVLDQRKEWGDVFYSIYFEQDNDWAITRLFRLLTDPNQEEVLFWGELRYATSADSQEVRHLAKPKAGIYYLIRPDRLVLDYKKSFWRIGFYRRLPLSYKLLLRLMMPKLKFSRVS